MFFLISGFWYFAQFYHNSTEEEFPSSIFSETELQGNFLNENEILQQEDMDVEVSFQEEKRIFVYVCGAVRQAGVYSLQVGDRLYMAVELAGGFTENAAKEYHNLARVVEDGERIYILTIEEWEKLSVQEQVTGEAKIEEQDLGEKIVNLNTASLEELMTLPMIGESKAKLIIEYRTKVGKFKNIEELMNISGIGESMFAKVKDRITIE